MFQETHVLVRVENHRDRLMEVMGVFPSEKEAEEAVKRYEDQDRRLMAHRGRPNVTLYHYTISGPWMVEVGEDNGPSRGDLISSQSE